MFKLARVGDKGDHGGQIITGDDTHIVDDQKVARVGDLYKCAIPQHGVNKIIAQSAEIYYNGNQKTAHIVSQTECGAKIITGSDDMIIDRIPDQEDNGGFS